MNEWKPMIPTSTSLVAIKWPWRAYMELDATICDFGYAGSRPVARTIAGTVWHIYNVLGLFVAVRWSQFVAPPVDEKATQE